MEYIRNRKCIDPKMMTLTAIAAMKSLDPEVKSWPRMNITLVARFDVSPKRSPI